MKPSSLLAFAIILALLLSPAVLAQPAQSGIIVHISAYAGDTPPSIYVAVARADEPWSNPLHELITSDRDISWSLPAGRYRVMSAARNFETTWSEVVDVPEGERKNITLDLRRALSVSGTVETTDGRPLRNARVGYLGQFALDRTFRLSAKAEEITRANALASTDADGRFILPARHDTPATIVVEADGYSPVLLTKVRAAETPELGDIRLAQGASLTLVTNGSPDDVLQLLPAKATAVQFSRETVLALWARSVSPSLPSVTWPSLAPGDYDIILRGTPGADITPRALMTVHLAPGDNRRETIQLPRTTAATDSATPQLSVRLLLQAQTKKSPWAVRAWEGSSQKILAVLKSSATAGGVLLDLTAPCSDATTFEVTGNDRIGVARAARCTEPIPVTLHPRADVTLRFRGTAGASVGTAGVLRAYRCGTNQLIFQLPFAIDADQRAKFAVPAGCTEPVLALRGFAPVALTAVRLAPGTSIDIGTQVLWRGGSALVRVLRDGRPLPAVQVAAVRLADFQAATDLTAPDAVRPLASTASGNDGWLRLTGLPIGPVVFRLVAPSEPPQYTDKYVIAAGTEIIADRLELPPPGSLRVNVTARNITQQTFQISEATLHSDPSNALAPRETMHARINNGVAEFTNIPSGAWQLSVMGRARGSFPMELAKQSVTINPGLPQDISIDVQSSLYRGHFVSRGAPPVGRLFIRPVSPEKGSAANTALDEQGAFTVVLSAPGDYLVMLDNSPHGMRALSRPVRFSDPSDDVAIELPTGAVSGRVLDRGGRGVADAEVLAVAPAAEADAARPEVSATTTADGTYVVDGLSDGIWSLHARAGLHTTKDVSVSLLPQQHQSGVDLVIQDDIEIKGHLLDALGAPVVRAYIELDPLPRTPQELDQSPLSIYTDETGAFQFDVPKDRSGSIALFRFKTRDNRVGSSTRRLDGTALTLTLAIANGAARIRNTAGDWPQPERDYLRLIADDGSSIGALFGGNYTGSSSGKRDLIIQPHLPAGHWRFVIARSPQDAATLESGNLRSALLLAEFDVAPNQMIDVPVEYTVDTK